MLFKIIGASMVFASAAFYVEKILSSDKKRIDNLDAVIDLIAYIKNQIDLYATPLEKIYKSIDRDKLKRLCLDSPPKEFFEIVENKELTFDDETTRELSEFSSSLGKGYRDMQLKLCDRTLASLNNKKKALADAFPSRKKTVLALCFGVGGAVLIALI